MNEISLIQQAYPLSFMNEGDLAEIVELRLSQSKKTSHDESLLRLDEMGLRSGRTIQMLNNSNSHSVLVKVDNSRVALSRKIAMKIFVRNSK